VAEIAAVPEEHGPGFVDRGGRGGAVLTVMELEDDLRSRHCVFCVVGWIGIVCRLLARLSLFLRNGLDVEIDGSISQRGGRVGLVFKYN
jgi:hypothetical protein